MSAYTKLAANVLFPFHEKLKGHSTIKVFRSMEESQWLSPSELQMLQVQRLREFLSKIGQSVPYYRELFKSLSFDPTTVTDTTHLQKLPLMGKPEIRANTDQMKADGASDLQRFNTGGSSGQPLIFFLGKERVSHDVAAKRRATRWWDVDIGDPEIVVWGSPIELGSQDKVRLLRDRLFRTHLLPAFEMSEENLDIFIAEIVLRKPKMLFGYPSSLTVIAEHAERRGIEFDAAGMKVVFVTSERLYDYQREKIEAVFGCKVANGYGGRDAGFIAHQCPQGELHITAEDIIVEIVNENGQVQAPGVSGEIVVTHLATSEFPFVRYKTGDVGALTERKCQCGRGLPLLDDLQGRTTDFIVAEDGSLVHGLALIYVLRDLPGIESFKITQHTQTSITVMIVPSEAFDRVYESQIVSVFKSRLGSSVIVEFDYAEKIPAEKSGKFRYIVSHVQR